MVECLVQRLPERIDLAEIDTPAELWINGPVDDDFDRKAVPVNPGALVAGGNVRQLVSCLEIVRTHQSNLHDPGLAAKLNSRTDNGHPA